jgi:hypothetical protein
MFVQVRPGAVTCILAKNIQEDAPEQQDYPVRNVRTAVKTRAGKWVQTTTDLGTYDTETEAAEKVAM